MNNQTKKMFLDLVGKPCGRRYIKFGQLKSFGLGFGNKINNSSPSQCSTVYCEWELGTYQSAWRIIKDATIWCGSQDVLEDTQKFEEKLNSIELGGFCCIRQMLDFNIRVELGNGVFVDFFPASSDLDECFHLFCPNGQCLEFSMEHGWRFGPSNESWDQNIQVINLGMSLPALFE